MKNKIILASFILLCELVGIAGSFFTASAIPGWYASLNQPSFLPPNWVFGPVWTVLYAMLGIVLYLIWREGINRSKIKVVFRVFLVQLILNGIWTPIFFGLKNLNLAFIVIILLWVSIIYLIYILSKINKLAAWLLVPYLSWITFAGILNYSFMVLN